MSEDTSQHRRQFLIASSAVALHSVSANVSSNTHESAVDSDLTCQLNALDCKKLNELTAADFQKLVDHTFYIDSVSPTAQLRLISVDIPELNADYPTHFRAPFSLHFESASEQSIESSIHELRNAELGNLKIFISPVGLCAHADKQHYEAVFA
jgi:hypothetical protein